MVKSQLSVMNNPQVHKNIDNCFGMKIIPGESKNAFLSVSESYSSLTVQIPIHVIRAEKDGPSVFVSAALHGDEINGTGAIRQLILENIKLERGNLFLIPVLNILAFDRHSRYLPDRRDLNRSFPGSPTGSLASRMAYRIFNKIIPCCNYGIDLHTAAIRRTNYPNIRGDISNPAVRKLAKSFGSELILNNKGPIGGFRREACNAGCPSIILEGGEIWKVEPSIVDTIIRGIKNILHSLEMFESSRNDPTYQIIIERSKWIRADYGGFLQFHVKPGDFIEKDEPLATNTTLMGQKQNTLYSPFNAVVIGMTTLPAVSPGEPICNLGMLPKGVKLAEIKMLRNDDKSLEHQVTEDLASSILVVEKTN